MSGEIVLAGGARTPIGSFCGALSQVAAPALGSLAIKAAIAAGQCSRRTSRRSDLRQRAGGRPGPERGPAGRHRSRPFPGRRRDHRQQGLRLQPQGGHAGRPGDQVRRCRGDRRRRDREHVFGALPAAQGPQRISHGQRRTDRFHDPGRPVGRLQQRAHGHLRGPLRGDDISSRASSRTILRWPATSGRSRPSRRACLPRKSLPSRSPIAAPPRRSIGTKGPAASTKRSCGACSRPSTRREP